MTRDTVAIITGAVGGMGQACARALGRRHGLFLTDLDQARLADFAASLVSEGHTVAGVASGDLRQATTAPRLVARARQAGRLAAVIHTAGLSPALAGWEDILTVNLAGTERLLRALEEAPEEGLVAVLMASISGHLTPSTAEADAVLADPLAPDFLARIRAHLDCPNDPEDRFSLGGQAYGYSKRAVMRLCETRAPDWGLRRARIVSISPGVIRTPMGQAEVDANPGAAHVLANAPLGRWGSVLDIAAAASFLCSDQASFITGCDLRVDGGVTPALAASRAG